MRAIVLTTSAILFTTSPAAEGAQIAVNADTLIKAAYCLGARQVQLTEAKQLLDSPVLPPNSNLNHKEIEELKLLQNATDGLKSEEAKLGKMRAYVATFLYDNSLSTNIRNLVMVAGNSGRQDADECRKLG